MVIRQIFCPTASLRTQGKDNCVIVFYMNFDKDLVTYFIFLIHLDLYKMNKHLIVASRAACFVDDSPGKSAMHWHWLRIRIVNHGVCLQTI
jgi:hypothetical protein